MKQLGIRLLLVISIFSVVCLAMFGFDTLAYLGQHKDLNEITASEFKSNQAIDGEAYFTFGCVVEEYTTKNGVRTSNKNSKQYYLVPVGEEEYVLLAIPAVRFYEFDRLADESYDWYFDETGELPPPTEVHFEGKTAKLDKEVKNYLYSWFIENDFFGTSDKAVIDQYIIPYVLEYKDWKTVNTATTVSGIALLVCIAIFVLSLVLGKKKKSISYTDMASGGIPEAQLPSDTSAESSDSYQYSAAPSDSSYDDHQKPPCEL